MNRWEKEVLESLLGSEEEALKELERQYARALADINQKVKLFQADIDLLDQALSQDGLDDATKALLQSRKRSKVYQQQYQQALQGQVGSILDKMHGDNYATIDKYLHGCYETGYIGTMYDIAKQGIPVIVPIDQAAVIKAILTDSKVSGGLYNRLGVDVGKLKKTITQEISRGIATGMGYGDIARNIRNVSGAPMSRTKTIARTEGHRIQQTSAVNAQQKAKAKGADVLKQWDAALDGRTRDSHRQVDGEIKELDEKFSNGLMFPGDPNGGAAEVVNCRCTSNTRARWALGEEELQTLKERAEYFGLDKTENFKEFEEKYLKAAKTLENDGKSGIIKLSDILFGKSIGAKAKNYEVMDLDTGEMFRFAEGTRLQDVEVFAGKGTKSILNIAGKYAKAYGGKPEDWQHVKGHGVLDTPDGYRNAEVHWMQCEGFGKHDFFVKKWED
uniref:Minor capsid protein n=1 Tax=Myoviridae sp. ct25F5 TaxID=2826604 RepID=A0A8S5LT47_9CAUD|nr:MAG TPA: minor capsid protein [Myoviridae sp. ct25F5]